jgi:hypothetical protein
MGQMTGLISSARAAKDALGRNAADFSLEYISVAGRRFGNTAEWESRLTVDYAGSATYFRRRGPGDSSEFPPGQFEGAIPREEINSFLDSLADDGFDLGETESPGPRDPIDILRLVLMGRCFELAWGSSRRPSSDSSEQIKDRLRDWTLNACPKPRWSLSLEIESFHCLNGRVESRLRVLNDGSHPIWIAHPASPGYGNAFGLILKYGERVLVRDGFTPLPVKAKVAPILQSSLPVPELLKVVPGQPILFEYSGQLEGEAPRGWAGKFAFHHYLPEDSIAGLPVFNGAIFTEEIKW